MTKKLADVNPRTTLRFYDSDPHPRTVLSYLADILLDFGDTQHDALIARALRTGREHPRCTIREDRHYSAITLIVSMIDSIDKLARKSGLRFISRDYEGYVLYQFTKK